MTDLLSAFSSKSYVKGATDYTCKIEGFTGDHALNIYLKGDQDNLTLTFETDSSKTVLPINVNKDDNAVKVLENLAHEIIALKKHIVRIQDRRANEDCTMIVDYRDLLSTNPRIIACRGKNYKEALSRAIGIGADILEEAGVPKETSLMTLKNSMPYKDKQGRQLIIRLAESGRELSMNKRKHRSS